MSRKRKAGHQLTKDNYEDDNKPSKQVGIGFEKASDDILQKRVRLKVRRKFGTTDIAQPSPQEEDITIPIDTSVSLNEETFHFDFKSTWGSQKEEEEKKTQPKETTDDLIIPPPPEQDSGKMKELQEENDELMTRIKMLEQQLKEGLLSDLVEPPKEEKKEKKEEGGDDMVFKFEKSENQQTPNYDNDDIPFDFLPDSLKKEEGEGEKEKKKEEEGGFPAKWEDNSFNIPGAFGPTYQNFVFDFGDDGGQAAGGNPSNTLETPSKLHVSLTSPFGKGTKDGDMWAPKEGDDLDGSDLNVGSPLPPPKYDLKDVNYEHKSGEEGEVTRYKCPAKLYVLATKDEDESQHWQERGIGEIKVNIKKEDENKTSGLIGGRLLMHRGESLTLLLNSLLFEDFPMHKLSQKKITFTCIDFGEDDEEEAMDNRTTTKNDTDEGEGNSFLITFRTEKDCESFYNEVESLTRRGEKRVRKEKQEEMKEKKKEEEEEKKEEEKVVGEKNEEEFKQFEFTGK